MMLPYLPKDNRSLHNLARKLLTLGEHDKRPRRKNRHHPKDFLGGSERGDNFNSSKNRTKKKLADVAAATSVPDPIPNDDIRHTSLAPPVGSTLYILPPVSQALSIVEASVSLTLSSTTMTTPTISSTSTPSLAISTANSAKPTPSTVKPATSDADASSMEQKNSHRPSTGVIVMLAVGSAFTFVAIMILLRLCNRPRKRAHPIPSNPILQDEYSSDKYASDDSPIFGGKDRLSNNGHTNSALWPWTQYHSDMPKPASAATLAKAGGGSATNYVPTNQEKEQYQLASLTVPGTNTGSKSQQGNNTISRTTSRLSAASMSFYANSPRSPQDIGLAIIDDYVADDNTALARSKSMPKRRNSFVSPGSNRESMSTRYSQGIVYNAIASPTLPRTSQSLPKISIAPATASSGRARVKSSYYAPGSYPRVSNANAVSSSVSKTNNANPFDDPFDSLPGMQKSRSRRDRDTHALTSALGLASPAPPSPQPTLYPDDSLSMIGGYTSRKSNKRESLKPALKAPAPRHRLDTPPMDSADALGSLMLVDFGSGLTTLKSVGEGIADQANHTDLKRSDDKPPRVPSPPPLPSLTQMGLAHANPEAYASYRSPTYSIYGLYEADRKSKATSFGY